MGVSEKRAQVYLPPDLYSLVERRAHKKGMSVSALIREAIREHLQREGREIDWERDPLWNAVAVMKSGRGDLSVKHDATLYGVS